MRRRAACRSPGRGRATAQQVLGDLFATRGHQNLDQARELLNAVPLSVIRQAPPRLPRRRVSAGEKPKRAMLSRLTFTWPAGAEERVVVSGADMADGVDVAGMAWRPSRIRQAGNRRCGNRRGGSQKELLDARSRSGSRLPRKPRSRGETRSRRHRDDACRGRGHCRSARSRRAPKPR